MSSLKAIYQDFLAKPRADALSNHAASLNYIITLTTITPAAAIVKHVAAHQQVLKKKEEKVLSAIEGQGALCLDVETTLEFITGGGAYLPGLDDNFLADRVVTFPMVNSPSITIMAELMLISSFRVRFISYSLMRTRKSKPFVFTGTKAPCSSSWT